MGRDHREWQKVFFASAARAGGICCDAWFKLGAQNSVNNGGYVYHCPPELRKDGQRYAVNYVWERELYIAWNVTSPDAQGQTVFRLLQGALEGAEPNRLLAVEKAEGHRGWGKRRCMSLAETRWMRFGRCDGGRNRRPRPMKKFGQENGRFSVLGEASIVHINGLTLDQCP